MSNPKIEEEIEREELAIKRLQHNPDYRMVLQRMEEEIQTYREMLPYQETKLESEAARLRALDSAYKILTGQ